MDTTLERRELGSSNDLEPVAQHISGDSLGLPFAVLDEDADTEDARTDLTGATIVWALVDWDERLALSTAHDGVTSTITSPINGEFIVEIESGTGEDLEGTFEEWVRVVTSDGERQTWVGSFTAEEGVL